MRLGGMAPGYPPGAGGPDLYIDVNVPTYKYNKFDIIKLPVERSFENISIDQVGYLMDQCLLSKEHY